MKLSHGLPRSLALLLVASLGCASPASPDTSAFIAWAERHAVPWDNAAPDSATQWTALRDAVGSASIVGLGESRHDTREQLLFKAALVRGLIRDQGFRALILEESFPHAERIDRYVTSGEGDLRDVMSSLAGWYLWDTEEMLELVEWIRSFNESGERPEQVRVFGMDITAPAPGVREVLRELADAGFGDLPGAEDLGLPLQEGDHWPATWERYAALPEAARDRLAGHYDELVRQLESNRALLEETHSAAGAARLRWLAEIGHRGNALFSSADRAQGGAVRESGMARTVEWILEHAAPGRKAVVWAHNLHVAKSPFRMPGLAEGSLEPMGIQLSEMFAGDYIAIGGAFGQGAFSPELPPGERSFPAAAPEVLDGALAMVGSPSYLLDIRGTPPGSAADTWLHQPRISRAQDADAQLVPRNAFDLVYFVRDISRSQPTPRALESYRAEGR